MSSELQKIQIDLNSKEYSPKMGYRRDVAVYELVCYVNNITGCYLSGYIEPIRVFIDRARIYIEDHKNDDENIRYYKLVESYLILIEKYLECYEVITK